MLARHAYCLATTLGAPVIRRVLDKRLAAGKEDPVRFAERRGQPGKPRPDGPLVWIHAASNGESVSALPLIERLLARDPHSHVLVTTGTVTSARLMEARLPPRAIHQYLPVDLRPWLRRFLDHWQPDLGIWIESEFWPGLIWAMRDSGKPMALVNGRISSRSLSQWRRFPGLSADLLGGFSPCLAQTPDDAAHLSSLGARKADCVGNLKLSAPPLPVDDIALEEERRRVSGRPVWLAASTHPGEEEIVAEADALLRESLPDLLTVVVPRHPKRGEDVAALMRAKGLVTARRAVGETVSPECQCLVADTLGELGLFYRLVPVSLIGGSLVGGHGGHNPIEALQLGCVPVIGPDMTNFSTVAASLTDAGGAVSAASASDVADAVTRLLADPGHRQTVAQAGEAVARIGATTVDRVMARLAPVLPPIAPGRGQ
ncbi:3-deoxy-D-manno-octulosonic acid transferase [Rhodospirillaceae bacterium KN72]|uniref:3-deoxy-D-manno-octulosonic acid transferase n=1 Tax=Pacificispira spongiicola TaxID=2729598 RepID=A0A7Y0E199_9PROT|nr:glycosyltransferase N-terminal domain-containing protein [Pacificispira spongiicola]NMM45403.1 3-deoxy-D-manno-octulosonic acid transferase [Pacificispira spongiicola]